MNFIEFEKKLRSAIPVGFIFENPGGGRSKITSYFNAKVYYQRGKSTMSISFQNLYDAYMQFIGCKMLATDLKKFKPEVFDSNARPAGHSCNCTFLMLALKEMGLVDNIYGHGVRGNPFYVDLR